MKVIISVWVVGVFFAFFQTNISTKKNCIEEEGVVKGWLWCESEGSLDNVVFKSMLWPLKYFPNDDVDSVGGSKGTMLNETERADGIYVGMIYSCYLSSLKLGEGAGRDAFVYAISALRKQNDFVNENHEDYIYNSQLFLNAIDRDEETSVDEFYNEVCIGAAGNIKALKDDGMY